MSAATLSYAGQLVVGVNWSNFQEERWKTDEAAIKGAKLWTSPSGIKLWSIFLKPVLITKANLSVVVDAGWITKAALCQGVTNGPAPCN